MSNNKIIALVGMPGSGKGTCTDYINEKYNWPVIHFGNMVYEEVKRRGLNNVEDEIFVREDMRAQDGPAVLAKHVAKKIDEYLNTNQTKIVLDGLYSWTEYKYLSERYGNDLMIIAVTAPKKVRRQRVMERNDSHRKYTLDQLIVRELAEIESLEKGGPIAYADYTINNDNSAAELISKLDLLLGEEKLLSN